MMVVLPVAPSCMPWCGNKIQIQFATCQYQCRHYVLHPSNVCVIACLAMKARYTLHFPREKKQIYTPSIVNY